MYLAALRIPVISITFLIILNEFVACTNHCATHTSTQLYYTCNKTILLSSNQIIVNVMHLLKDSTELPQLIIVQIDRCSHIQVQNHSILSNFYRQLQRDSNITVISKRNQSHGKKVHILTCSANRLNIHLVSSDCLKIGQNVEIRWTHISRIVKGSLNNASNMVEHSCYHYQLHMQNCTIDCSKVLSKAKAKSNLVKRNALNKPSNSSDSSTKQYLRRAKRATSCQVKVEWAAAVPMFAIFPLCVVVILIIYVYRNRARYSEKYTGHKKQPKLSRLPDANKIGRVSKDKLMFTDVNNQRIEQPDSVPRDMSLAIYSGSMVLLKPVSIKPDTKKETLKQITREVSILRQRINGENVLTVFGICSDNDSVKCSLVLEYCYRGTLKEVLLTNACSRDLNEGFLCDLAAGLYTIHTSSYKCHGSLRSTNCYVNAHFSVKIGMSDFALPTVRCLKYNRTPPKVIRRGRHRDKRKGIKVGRGSIFGSADTQRKPGEQTLIRKKNNSLARYNQLLWTAPEILKKLDMEAYEDGDLEALVDELRELKKFDMIQKADVYSLAIIMNECLEMQGTFPVQKHILSSRLPDDSAMKILQAVIEDIDKTETEDIVRPDTSWIILPEFAEKLILQCWSNKSNSRPDLPDILHKLKKARKNDEIKIGEFFDQYIKIIEKQEHDKIEVIAAMHSLPAHKIQDVVDSLMPRQISEAFLCNDGRVDMKRYQSATILFGDCTGFSRLVHAQAQAAHTETLVVALNNVFTKFDTILTKRQQEGKLYKVETIGEQYMIVSGLPTELKDHAEVLANIALDMMDRARDMESLTRKLPGTNPNACLQFRIGIHTGTVVAGLTGHTLPRYRMIGDTVNYASRISIYSYPGLIHLSEQTATSLAKTKQFVIESRGIIEIKGKGSKPTYWLRSRVGTPAQGQTDLVLKMVKERDAKKIYKMPSSDECIELLRLDKHNQIVKSNLESCMSEQLPENIQNIIVYKQKQIEEKKDYSIYDFGLPDFQSPPTKSGAIGMLPEDTSTGRLQRQAQSFYEHQQKSLTTSALKSLHKTKSDPVFTVSTQYESDIHDRKSSPQVGYTDHKIEGQKKQNFKKLSVAIVQQHQPRTKKEIPSRSDKKNENVVII